MFLPMWLLAGQILCTPSGHFAHTKNYESRSGCGYTILGYATRARSTIWMSDGHMNNGQTTTMKQTVLIGTASSTTASR